LLLVARRRNSRLNVIDIMRHRNECFKQVPEGEETIGRAFYEYSSHDACYQQVIAQIDKPVTPQAFAKYSMAL